MASGPKSGAWRRLLCLGAVLGMSVASPADAQDLRQKLSRFLYDDASAYVHFRSFYEDRRNLRPPDSTAWTGGGWVSLQTGWFYDVLQLGAVGYTTQPFWAPRNRDETSDGTLLLKPGGYGFFTLGQAYASLRVGEHGFRGFRQLIDELEVNPNDDRMIPNTFEAYTLGGRFGPVTYLAGYVAAMKPRDYSAFINMGERAGVPNHNAGMALATLKYGSMDKLMMRTGLYHVPDILTSSYTDVSGALAVSDSFKVKLSAQFMVQGSNGLHLLTGTPFSTFAAGGRAEAVWRPGSLWLVYTQTGSAAAYRNPYGQWIGYTKQITRDFDRAGERAFQVGLTADFAAVGLAGVSLLASATLGDRAIDPATGRNLANTNEYDFDLTFNASEQPVPGWLKPLQLRFRLAFIDDFLNGAKTSTTEARLIMNYVLTLKETR